MRHSCNIVKDLLPLYLEGMASGDSRAMVEDHLSECDACQAELESIRTFMNVPPETDVGGLKKLDRTIRRRRTNAAVLAILVTAAVLFSIFMYLYSPIYLTMERAIAGVNHTDGMVIVEFTAEAGYFRGEDHTNPDTGRREVTVIAAKHRGEVLLEKLRSWGQPVSITASPLGSGRTLRLSEDTDIWYASTASGMEDILLWGNEINGGRVSLPRLVLGYYFMLALALGTVLLIPAIVLRRKKAGKFLGTGALLCFSFALSDLMATGGNWRIYDGYDVPVLLGLMLIQTVLLAGSVVCAVRVYKTNREDKGC